MIRTLIVVRKVKDKRNPWTAGERYVVFNSKKGNQVISTDAGTAIPINNLQLKHGFMPEQDMELNAPRDFRGFRIKFFNSRQDLFKYAEINQQELKPKTAQGRYNSLVQEIAGITARQLEEKSSKEVEYSMFSTTRLNDPRKTALYSVFDTTSTQIRASINRYKELTPEQVVGAVLEGKLLGVMRSGLYTEPFKESYSGVVIHRTGISDKAPWVVADEPTPWTPSPEDDWGKVTIAPQWDISKNKNRPFEVVNEVREPVKKAKDDLVNIHNLLHS